MPNITSNYIVVFCTVPDEYVAEKIANKVVQKKLAACCNIIPGLRSIYIWKNEIQDDKEMLLIIKTKKDIFTKLQKAITEIHPYSIPEIISISIENGSKNYLNWVEQNVKQ
jgi:periplasmic divalent cation tolerance protein